MLERLSVKNFAIIEDITVDFMSGMTVLTGETGAGKSLIIDTISLLLGSRADSDMIRYGKNSASITGIFTNTDEITSLLNKYGINQGDKVTIIREITDSSKNVIKVNGTNITLQMLKNIGSILADIHVQNDTNKLFNPDNYLEFLDPKNDTKFNQLLGKYSKSLILYMEAMKDYEYIQKGQKTALERLEFMQYEANELSELDLYPNKDKELEDTISKLSNFDKISKALGEAYSHLENDYAPIDQIYEASKALKSISEFDKEYSSDSEKLLDAYYIIDEIKGNISSNLGNLDYDEEELNNSIETLNQISKVKEKYHKTVDELIAYLKEITLKIEMVTNYDETLKEKQALVLKTFEQLKKDSEVLSEYRHKLATKLEAGILRECADLELENTQFKILFEEVSFANPMDKAIFLENGVDKINFTISFNKGEPLKPLHKVASGGEMSRMMLAFKSYFVGTSLLSLMVFDEIDTGVSGSTAKKIAMKISNISKHLQVLCITHLPQVAAYGDYHKHIYKVEEDNRTFTQIKDLTKEERIEEIAMMLSGDKISVYALEHAKELLNKKEAV